MMLGSEAASTPVVNASSVRGDYDCDAGYSSYETEWTKDRQGWCCKHHNKACRVAPQDCNTRCHCKGGPVTCRFRIQWNADHIFPGNALACTLAHQRVVQNCPCCSVCTLSLADCIVSKTKIS